MFDFGTNNYFGTELIAEKVQKLILPLAPSLNNYKWFLVPGFYKEPDENTIMYNHLEHSVGDVQQMLNKSFTDKFKAFLFVSNWQQRKYVERFGIDETKCFVIRNAIEPIQKHKKPNTKIVNLIYYSDEIRGLSVLFDALQTIEDPNLRLHVFREIKHTKIPDDPRIIMHGKVKPKEIAEALKKTHIFAYPCTHEETSCISLMEAMSAGCYCLTSNYAALPETSMNLTHLYTYQSDPIAHAKVFAKELQKAIDTIRGGWQAGFQIEAANYAYSWQTRTKDWLELADKLQDTKD